LVCAFSFPFMEFTQITYIESEPLSNSVFSPPNDVSSSPIKTIALTEEKSFDWLKLLLNLYFIGLIFMGIRFLFQLISILNVLKQPKKRDTEGFYHIELTKKTSPFSFFHFIAYHLQSYQRNELELIIEHEKIHGRQYHSIDIILHQLMLVFLWFNPFAWWYNKQMLENLEFIANREVAKKNNIQQKEYELTLLKVSTQHPSPRLSNSFYQSLIKKRIVMLHKNASPKYAWAKSILILPLLSLFLWSFNVNEEVKFISLSENQSRAIDKNKDFMVKESIVPELEWGDTTFANHTTKTDTNQQENKKVLVSTTAYIITKSTSDKELKKIKKGLEKDLENVKVKFSDIQRNEKNEITSLTISSKFKENKRFIKNMTFSGIKAFPIKLVPVNNSIKIWNKNDEATIISNRGIITEKKITSDKLGENPLVIINGEEVSKSEKETYTSKDGSYLDIKRIEPEEAQALYGEKAKDGAIIMEEILEEAPKDIIAVQTPNMNEKIASSLRYQQDSILFIIDGKRVSKEEFNQIESNEIKIINVLKSKEAQKIYGEAAKDGAIIIKKKKTVKIDTETPYAKTSKTFYIKEIKKNQEEYMFSINGVKANERNVKLISPETLKELTVYTEKEAALKFNINTNGKKLIDFQLHKDGDGNSISPEEFLASNPALQNGSILIILDGTEITRRQLSQLNPDQIKSIFTVKGEKAIEKFGERAKDGVIVITTK